MIPVRRMWLTCGGVGLVAMLGTFAVSILNSATVATALMVSTTFGFAEGAPVSGGWAFAIRCLAVVSGLALLSAGLLGLLDAMLCFFRLLGRAWRGSV